MNSILQSLYSLKHFREEIRKFKEIKDKTSVLFAIQNLFSSISSKTTTSVIEMDDFIRVIKSKNRELNNEAHHDAHEFLTWLLDTLETNINDELGKKGNGSIENFISKTFKGTQNSLTKCLNCEKVNNFYLYKHVECQSC